MSDSLGFVIPLVKVDAERRLIIARAAQETPDRSREIMDYASAKPVFEKWSQGFSDATNGLSKGNVRVMHQKVVAGVVKDLSFNDAEKAVDVVMHIPDDQEWRKCLAGAYTGVSIGGGYARKWKDDETGFTRYTPDIRELSLVDLPCIPTAQFAELLKADGMTERLPLVGRTRTFAEQWSARPVSFAERWASRPRTFGELMKAAFDETKHPRAELGRFAAKGNQKDLSEDAKGRANAFGGAVGGAFGVAFAGDAALRAHQRFRFGTGEKGERNQAAAILRSQKPVRDQIRARAVAERGRVATSSEDQAAAAHRKILEEAHARGESTESAKPRAQAFADKVRRRSGGLGWLKGQRAASESIHRASGEVRGALKPLIAQGRNPGHLKFGWKAALPAYALGAGLGYASAARLGRENETGKPEENHLATAGDLARVGGAASLGASAGSIVGHMFLPQRLRGAATLAGAAAMGGMGLRAALQERAERQAAAKEQT